jgi:hypothetical protein
MTVMVFLASLADTYRIGPGTVPPSAVMLTALFPLRWRAMRVHVFKSASFVLTLSCKIRASFATGKFFHTKA